jgi:hypothetical protein
LPQIKVKPQSAFWQTIVDGLDTEQQYRSPVFRPTLKALNAQAKRLDNSGRGRCIHVVCNQRGVLQEGRKSANIHTGSGLSEESRFALGALQPPRRH